MTAPSLVTLATRALRDAGAHDVTVVLAISGGSDSTALLHVMARVAPRLGIRLLAHGVDHGLRAEAATELAQAAALAASLAIPWSTTSLQLAPGSNLQARARRARHAALEHVRAAHAAAFVATAHHAGDRAETVLLRLLRGAPAAGLGVLPVVAGTRLRPLVRAPKELILGYLRRHQLDYARDPSNDDPRFLRVRVRQELMPLLRALAPSIEETLCGLADAHVEDATNPAESADLALLRSLPRASLEALRRLARDRSEATRVWLPGGLAARWDGPHVEIRIEAGQEKPVRSRGPMKSRSILP
jgi:tRNA(Ile)-lysidine synthase